MKKKYQKGEEWTKKEYKIFENIKKSFPREMINKLKNGMKKKLHAKQRSNQKDTIYFSKLCANDMINEQGKLAKISIMTRPDEDGNL